MIPLNISEYGLQLANCLGCKLTHLPIIYLGIPFHYKNLTTEQWNFLIENFEKKKTSRMEGETSFNWWKSYFIKFSNFYCPLVLDVYL
jgi:hypothetical protein